MLSDEKPEIYLKRRRLALDYFQHIPEGRVDLITWLQGTPAAKRAHLRAVGLDALKCGTVGCLAGWLYTLPEYRDWAKEQKEETGNWRALCRWLDCSAHTFSLRMDHETQEPFNRLSDKAVALARLEGLIQEAERAVRKEAV